MATNTIKGFISDEEMAELESGASSSDAGFISDEEMNKLESAGKPPVDPQKGYFQRVGEAFKKNEQGTKEAIRKVAEEDVARSGKPSISGLFSAMSQVPALAGKNVMSTIGELPGVRKIGEIPLATSAKGEVTQRVKDIGKDELQWVGGKIGQAAEKYPIPARVVGGALNFSEVIPGIGFGKIAASGAVKGAVGVGKGIEEFGKTAKYGELKIPQSIAKKSYGKDLMEKKKNIVNDIAEFGVTQGNNAEAAADAMMKAGERFNRADELARRISADPLSPKVNPVTAATKELDVSRLADIDMEARAQGIIDQIIEGWDLKGLNAEQTLDKLIEAKQSLNKSGTLFSHAVGQSAEDNLRQAIKKKMYLNLVDAIGDISPEIKAMNTEAKRLLDVNSALTNAASRVANHDMVGLTDFVLGGASLANPGALAVAAPAFVVKKAFGNGRFGNAMINLGRGIQGKKPRELPGMPEPTIKPDMPDYEALSENPAFERAGIKPTVRTFQIPKGLNYSDVADNSKILTNAQRKELAKENGFFQHGFKETNAADMGEAGISGTERTAAAFMGKQLPPETIVPQGRLILPVSKEGRRLALEARKREFMSTERGLPAPMIETNAPAQQIVRQMPTMGDRMRAIGVSNKPLDIPKGKRYNKGKGESYGNNPKNQRRPGGESGEIPPGPEGLPPLEPTPKRGGTGPKPRGKPSNASKPDRKPDAAKKKPDISFNSNDPDLSAIVTKKSQTKPRPATFDEMVFTKEDLAAASDVRGEQIAIEQREKAKLLERLLPTRGSNKTGENTLLHHTDGELAQLGLTPNSNIDEITELVRQRGIENSRLNKGKKNR